MRTSKPLSRLISLAALVVAVMGCEADDARTPGSRLASPVTPTALQVSISTDRSSLRAGTTSFALISWTATNVPQGTPVPNGTVAAVSTTLGSLNSLGGGASTEIEMFGGAGSVRLYAPTAGTGIARVRVEIDGVVAVVQITITAPAGPPVPAPTAATITVGADTLVVLEATASTPIIVTATVLGSDAEPFDNAPVQFSSPTGTFGTSGSSTSEVLGTGNDGTVSDTLTVLGPSLPSGSSFNITATLFVEGGGTKTANVTITIVHADDPPTPTSIELSFVPDSTIQRDSGSQVTTLRALVQDQYLQPMTGIIVTFSTVLGAVTGGDQVDVTMDATDAAGYATATLTVTEGQLDVFAGASFSVTAAMSADTDSASITIVGEAGEDPVPTTVDLTLSPSSTVTNDGGAAEVVTMNAVVRDQFNAAMNGVVVTFTTQLGAITGGDVIANMDTTAGGGLATVTLTLGATDLANFVASDADDTFNTSAIIAADTDTEPVFVITPPVAPPVASFTIVQSPDLNGDPNGIFLDTSTGVVTTRAWDLDGDNIADDGNIAQPSFNYLTAGFNHCDVVTITLTVSNSQGSDSAQDTITVIDSSLLPCP